MVRRFLSLTNKIINKISISQNKSSTKALKQYTKTSLPATHYCDIKRNPKCGYPKCGRGSWRWLVLPDGEIDYQCDNQSDDGNGAADLADDIKGYVFGILTAIFALTLNTLNKK